MTDELDQVVRQLEAERHRPSLWWARSIVTPEERRRELEAALDAFEAHKKEAS